MKASYYGLKVAKSSTGYYVGRFFQEDEVITQFVRLTDDFSSKQEAFEWIESIMEEITERKGDYNMVPIDRTLEKECFIYRYFFIYLNLKIWGLGERL